MNMLARSKPFVADGPVAAEAQCVLDLVHLSRQTLGDRALEMELLELFQRQAAGVVARLTGPGAATGNTGADIAHMLKGSARAVGAFAVARAAADLEEAMRCGPATKQSLEALARAVAEARGTIAALIG